MKYAPQRVKTLFIEDTQASSEKLRPIIAEANANQIEVIRVTKFLLDERTESAPHQGILAECQPKEMMSLTDFRQKLKKSEETKPAFILALDQVSDPRNLGAIIRVAMAANVDGILLPKHGSAAISGVVDRASAGTLTLAPLVEVTNLADAINTLKDDGIWWATTAVEAPIGSKIRVQSYLSVDFKGPIGLVLGSEGDGVRQRVNEACDFWITIPMNPQVESLNVSVATGVLLFEVLRQRQ